MKVKAGIGVLLLTLAAWAQVPTATLRGVVDDSSGAVVAGAEVSLTAVATNVRKTFTTEANGQFTFSYLEPGEYALAVKATGFATHNQTGIIVEVGQVAVVNVALKVGSVSENITVTANALQLETGNAALGATIDRQNIDALPLNGRNPYQLAALSSSVTTHRSTRSVAFQAGQGSVLIGSFSVNGGRVSTNDFTLDGVPLTTKADNAPSLAPSADSLQEFRVQTNSYSAEFGHSGGGAVSFSTRSGTNQYRGTLWEFLRNDALDAANFFANATNSAKQKLRYNQFGGNFGGPLRRDKLFIFVNYEDLRVRQAQINRSSVPSVAMKNGDFSQLLGAAIPGATVQDTAGNTIPARAGMIFTTGAAAARRAFAGNVIPAALRNPVALKAAAFFPDPNRPGLVNNYVVNSPTNSNQKQISVRMDYVLSPSQQLYGRFTRNFENTAASGTFPGSLATTTAVGNIRSAPTNAVLDYVKTMSSRFVLHANAGWTHHTLDRSQPGQGFDPTSLGFPANVLASGASRVFPSLAITGYGTLGPLRNFGLSGNNQDVFNLAGDGTWVRGTHNIRFGGLYRVYRLYLFRADDPAGNFAFTRAFVARTPTEAITGDAFAAFLLGFPASGRIAVAPAVAVQSKYFGIYFQDDWKVNRRLTLNLGLRYDSDLPNTERFNRLTNFAVSDPFPVNTTFAFPAALGLTARSGPFPGRIVFLGRGGNSERGQSKADLNNVAPRVGVAFQVNNRLVIRAGAGIFFSPMSGGGVSSTTYALVGDLAATTYTASNDNGVTPAPGSSLSNPFPAGINQAPGASRGALTGYGDSPLTVRLSGIRNPYMAQWNFNIQQELPGQWIAEAAYAGSAGVGLLGGTTDLNQLSPQALALGATVLNTQVANPFLTVPVEQRPPATSAVIGRATVSVAQLLRPYPQFGQVQSFFANDAHSTYHALQLRMQRRFSRGLTFQASYTFSKVIDDISVIQSALAGSLQIPNYQDSNNRRLDKSLSTMDARKRFVANFSYALPWGKGQRFLNRSGFVDVLLGGWTVNGIVSAQGGFPLSVSAVNAAQVGLAFTQLRPNIVANPGIDGGSKGDRILRWFNTAAFAQPASFSTGNAGRTLPNVRGPGYTSVDAGLHKSFRFNERIRLQFRAEAFNLFNRVNLGRPGNVLGAQGFGIISDAEDPRLVQFGLKLSF